MIHSLFYLSRPVLTGIIVIFFFYTPPCRAQAEATPPAGRLILPSGIHTVPLQWYGDSVLARWEPHAALLLPVKFPHCPEQFYMQFDLGATYSMFYSQPLKEIQLAYPLAVQLKDSAAILPDGCFTTGSMPVRVTEMPVRQSGLPAEDRYGCRIIGTIGADLVENKVVVIDYPQMTLCIGDSMPAGIRARITLSDFIFSGRRILLPARIRDKKTLLYFDTGSSAYELISNEATCRLLATPGGTSQQYQVNSWGKMITAHTLPTGDSITIASQKLPIRQVTYMTGMHHTQVEQMMKLGIGGMTGNKLFLHSVLVLDTRRRKMGIAFP
ncbi:hypothetical protein [Chitinophaga japonensis]|uniref:Aspartyl protease n=1 Tax=Chitinophaga japonensis TaxID=104662 RepID=A0A562T3U7_CHIJA|nr:hypothetical protein [Chitinophaga japonensis]TWI88225.1 hypothetical protein LX66_2308 [Chitinophaga japonensis]